MRRFWPLAAILILLLTACGTGEPDHTAEQAFTNFLTHMKQGEYDQAEAYIHGKDDEDLFTDDLKNFDGGNRGFIDKLQSFDFTVQNSEETEDKATVQVTATHKNMVPVFADVMTELTVLILGDPKTQALNDEQMQQKVNDMLAERTLTMEREKAILDVEKEFAVDLLKDGKNWKVDLDNDDLVMMLTGNIFRTAEDEADTDDNGSE